MRWYISGPSLMMLAAALAALRRREVVSPESRTRVLIGTAILVTAAAGLIVLDLVT